jgi:hypothetical protein
MALQNKRLCEVQEIGGNTMKEMVYKNYMENGQEVIEILDEGIYKSFHYVIVSYGTHPCAYIEIPKDNVSDEDELIDISCHGGITYVSTAGLFKPSNKNHRDGHWIGWDYAHCMDYCYSLYNSGLLNDNKKWTTKEILEEVKDVIEQLIKS